MTPLKQRNPFFIMSDLLGLKLKRHTQTMAHGLLTTVSPTWSPWKGTPLATANPKISAFINLEPKELQ